MVLEICGEFVSPVVTRDKIKIVGLWGGQYRFERLGAWICDRPRRKPGIPVCIVRRIHGQIRLADVSVILSGELERIDYGGVAGQRDPLIKPVHDDRGNKSPFFAV